MTAYSFAANGVTMKALKVFRGQKAHPDRETPERSMRMRSVIQESLHGYASASAAALSTLAEQDIIARIWAHDHTAWKKEPAGIANRLGWLTIARRMREQPGEIADLVESVRADGYAHTLLLGMGGSSLAPEVFRKTYGAAPGHPDLSVLDSTEPQAVLDVADRLDPAKTLYVVSTKSGSTVETLSFFKFFYNQAVKAVGSRQAGSHFVAITDAGSRLDRLAEQHSFRSIFLNDPNIGGRFSALSYVGLLPGALIGMDLPRLLDRAVEMAEYCAADVAPQDNPAARLGAILGRLASEGRDKLTVLASPAIASIGAWIEQLVAESTGKEGKGILPVVGEPPGKPEVYGEDRLFVYLRLENDPAYDQTVVALENAGHPVVRLHLRDIYDLGGQLFLWELATAVAGQQLGINPFDQPDVEATKVLTRQMAAAYQEKGALPRLVPALVEGNVAVYGDTEAESASSALCAFADQGAPGDYIAVQAYLQPTAAHSERLGQLQQALRDRSRLATTLGYGPRFLHSTGQLHKGDAGRGLFVQVTASPARDIAIPDEAGQPGSSISFGVLMAAQALGDRQALIEKGRRVLRIDLGADGDAGLDQIIRSLPECRR
jgi:glucose-6-phosphate isomerase